MEARGQFYYYKKNLQGRPSVNLSSYPEEENGTEKRKIMQFGLLTWRPFT